MTQVTAKKAEYVEFELVKEAGGVVRATSPWRMLRFAAMGVIGLALFAVMLVVGVLLVIPFLIFFAIARILSTLLPVRPRM